MLAGVGVHYRWWTLSGFIDGKEADRSRLFLYYEAFDPIMSFHVNPEDEDELVKLRVELLMRK